MMEILKAELSQCFNKLGFAYKYMRIDVYMGKVVCKIELYYSVGHLQCYILNEYIVSYWDSVGPDRSKSLFRKFFNSQDSI